MKTMMKSTSFKEEIRHDYPLTKDSIVFDVGGYKGEWSEIMYQKYGCRIFCFEPVFDIVNKNIAVFKNGLGARTRQESFVVDRDKTGRSCTSGTPQRVNIYDIIEYIEILGIDHIDLMKVNIEGMEYELLPRLIETGWINNITDLQVQFHNIVPQSDKHMWIIQNDLRKTHEPTWQYRWIWENWRRK